MSSAILSSAVAILLVCLANVASAQNSTSQSPGDACTPCDDVHFFLARGNNEPYPGRQGALVAATCDGLENCGYESLLYSALYTDLYCQTTYDGVVAGHAQMTAYAERCPNSKLILAGYSQGGQIATDILGGAGGYSFNGCYQPDVAPLVFGQSPANKIAAVIVFADVRHAANVSYNFGSGSPYNGYFPRTPEMLSALEQYAPIMRTWCVDTDPICAANITTKVDDASHLDYFQLYSNDAASWIKSVASLTETDTSFSTAIPTSISGTVQDYATIPTSFTPSGTVTLDTTWSSMTSYPPCTATRAPPSMSVASTTSTVTGTSVTGVLPAGATIGSTTASSSVAKSTSSSTTKASGSAANFNVMTMIQPVLLAACVLAGAILL